MISGNIHFEAVDCAGRTIVCTTEQWYSHILDEHDYMEDQEERVITALERPDYNIRHFDTDRNDCRVYYRANRIQEYYTKVVAKFDNPEGEGNGEVITAFMPDDIKPGEKPDLKSCKS